MNIFTPTVSTADLVVLMRNLKMTLKAGVPIVRALTLFEDTAPSRKRGLYKYLRVSVEQGNSFADALDTAPWKFPPLVVNLIRTGELAGSMEQSLDMIVLYVGKAGDLKRKLKGAMIYPSFLLAALFGFILLMGGFILPTLLPLFESMGLDLPLATRMLLWTARFFRDHGTAFFGTLFLVLTVTIVILRMKMMKPMLHFVYLHIPIIKNLVRNAALTQICRTLSTLLKNGIPIQKAVHATAEATSNVCFNKALTQAAASLEMGRKLTESLSTSGNLFPRMTVMLLDIGEETGMMSDTLDYLTDYYESEVDFSVKSLTTVMEPLVLGVMGVIVGWTVSAIILPIYKITGSIG